MSTLATMRILVLAAAAVLVGMPSGAAQEEETNESLATKLADLVGISDEAGDRTEILKGYVANVVDQFRAEFPEAPKVFWADYEQILFKHFLANRPKLDYRKRYVQFATEYFSANELGQLIAFYESPLGKKVLASRKKWSAADEKVTDRIYREWHAKNNRLYAREYRKLLEKYGEEGEDSDDGNEER